VGLIIGLSMRRGYFVAFLVGLGKEYWDMFYGSGFDGFEVVVTAFGGMLGAIGICMFYLVRAKLRQYNLTAYRQRVFSFAALYLVK